MEYVTGTPFNYLGYTTQLLCGYFALVLCGYFALALDQVFEHYFVAFYDMLSLLLAYSFDTRTRTGSTFIDEITKIGMVYMSKRDMKMSAQNHSLVFT